MSTIDGEMSSRPGPQVPMRLRRRRLGRAGWSTCSACSVLAVWSVIDGVLEGSQPKGRYGAGCPYRPPGGCRSTDLLQVVVGGGDQVLLQRRDIRIGGELADGRRDLLDPGERGGRTVGE